MTFKLQNILPHEKRKTTKPNKKKVTIQTKRNEIKKNTQHKNKTIHKDE